MHKQSTGSTMQQDCGVHGVWGGSPGAVLRVALELSRSLLCRTSPLQLPRRTGTETSRSSAFLRDLGWLTSTGCPHMTLLASQIWAPGHTGWALHSPGQEALSSSHLSSQPIHATAIRLQLPKWLWTGMDRLGKDRTSCEWWCTSSQEAEAGG